MEKERRLQIIKAAEKRFVKHGLHKTTLDEIARDLRIGKSTLYHYFTSKENLFFSTVRWQIDQYILQLQDIFSKDLPSKEKINSYLEFKDRVFDNYKLILSLFIQFMNESYFEEELELLKELYLREENCIKEETGKINFKKEDLNFIFSSSLVHHSWGLVLNNRIVNKNANGTPGKDKEIINLILDAAVK